MIAVESIWKATVTYNVVDVFQLLEKKKKEKKKHPSQIKQTNKKTLNIREDTIVEMMQILEIDGRLWHEIGSLLNFFPDDGFTLAMDI